MRGVVNLHVHGYGQFVACRKRLWNFHSAAVSACMYLRAFLCMDRCVCVGVLAHVYYSYMHVAVYTFGYVCIHVCVRERVCVYTL